MTLAGKIALVTGAGREAGLGQAIARELGHQGAHVILHDCADVSGEIAPAHGVGNNETLSKIVAELQAEGIAASAMTADLLSEAEIAGLIGRIAETHGQLDILVNNAGIGYLFGALEEMKPEHWDAVLGVNLRAPALLSKYAIPLLRKSKAGRIINIASQAAKSGFAYATAYTASKHGLLGLTRALALELGPEKITVNAVCPNHVTTGLGAWQNDFMSKAQGISLDEYLARMRARIPLGRAGLPEDTAQVCAFLCSDAAQYVTAEAINVSGGEEYH